MNTIPIIGQEYVLENKIVRVTRVTGVCGTKDYRWCYYKNVDTGEFHCQRLDLFLKKYSK
jgi:hypothetical protein